ncbi:MAG: GDSL-type esterase/lipase family protein [Oscillospiraceae bacterium]|nr:GDSL-type esterase/lipase family protein [Oscillospiraceae bacterium]
MGKKTKNNGDKIIIAAGVLALVILFASASAAFYINRDAIYNFLRGGAQQSAPARNPRNQNPLDQNDIENLSGPSEYFKNIIFLGDSIVSGIEICKDSTQVNGEKVLEDTTVVAAVSYSLKNAVSEISENAINLTHEGKAMKPEDIVSRLDGKYVLICLGLNDLAWTPMDEYIENYGTLVKNIQTKNPDKTIAILSVTPVVAGGATLTNAVIAEANGRLRGFAAEKGLSFIDWAAAIRTENGSLHESLSSDGYCHLKAEAYGRLAEYLVNVMVIQGSA